MRYLIYVFFSVSKDIFNELDRWVPYNVIYKRIDINNFIEVNFEI